MASVSITVLNLSPRAYNLLRRNGITTIKELQSACPDLLITGCGRALRAEILASLALWTDQAAIG